MSSILLITGASRGIGLATATYFQAQGWHIVNISRNPCKLPGITNIQIDLSVPGWQQKYQPIILAALQTADKICLTHNAGLLFKDSVDLLPEVQLRKTLEVNVIAPALLNQIVLPMMKAGSSILYIGSTLSEIAAPNTASYVTSKHALLGLMRATCEDLWGRDISTVCICPGFTDTDMVKEHLQDPAVLAAIAAKIGSGRLASPQEMAELVYFCATHPLINGATLHANQGGPH